MSFYVAGTLSAMKWWSRFSTVQRVLLVGLFVCLAGLLGSLVFDYLFWPFSVAGCILVVIIFVLFVRAGLSASVPGRPELDKRAGGHRSEDLRP
jgi:hypothetical protein